MEEHNSNSAQEQNDLGQHVDAIHSLLSEWEDIDHDELLEQGGGSLKAQVQDLYALLSPPAQDSGHGPQRQQSEPDLATVTPEAVCEDLSARGHLIRALLAQLGDWIQEFDTKEVQDLAEEVRRLRGELYVVNNREIPRLRKQIRGLQKTVEQRDIDLAIERSLNWELRYRCRDLGERAWRRVEKRESEKGGPRKTADYDLEDTFMQSV